jgi:hypothetical protein
MKSPVLLVAWRRPELTRRVIASIRTYAPDQMYVACDGPNLQREGEVDSVNETRRVIESEIDWPCKIYRRYSETNQGCRLGVSNAISWFFENVSKGIILEDDCFVSSHFFEHCDDLLVRYENDLRVWTIGGCNFQDENWRGDGSYYFSRYFHCWGWATWASRWSHYDRDLKDWPALKSSGLMESLFQSEKEKNYWFGIWEELFKTGKPNTWDYQWLLTCMSNGGLNALPNHNLVENIGFGSDATHCGTYSLSMTVDREFQMLSHPRFVLTDGKADAYTFKKLFEPTIPVKQNYLVRKFQNAIHKTKLFFGASTGGAGVSGSSR